MGKLRHGVMRSKAMQQASDPAEIRALEARDAQPMLHPPDNAASHTWEHDSPTGVPPTCNGLLTLWASTRGAAHRGSGGWQSGCCHQSPLEKVSRASLQTPPAAVTFLRQRCPSTSSRTSWQSGYQRRSPQAINLWFLWPHQASVNSAELQSKWHLRIQAGCSKIHSSLGRHSLRKQRFQPVRCWILSILFTFLMQKQPYPSYQAWPWFTHIDWACASPPSSPRWPRTVRCDTSSEEATCYLLRLHPAE